MLANIEPTHNDFHALASYLIHGRDRPTHPDRVAWVFGHNISTDDPIRAAGIMAAFAERSRRCRNACYHLSINWHPDEQPPPEIMQEIARKSLTLAGLGEHQALVMGHGDKAHKHLHMMVNRVHPDTGRAWSTSHDYRRFDRIMKLLSEEYGFLYVPPHSFVPELTHELPKAPNSNARYAAKCGGDTSRWQWSDAMTRDYADQLSPHLDHASTWDDLRALVAEDGFTLEPKGQGFVVGNGASYVKLSRLGLQHGAKGLTRRRAPKRSRTSKPPASTRKTPHRRTIWTVDAVDIARAIGTRDELRAAVQEAKGHRKARLAKAPLMTQLMEEVKETLKASTVLSRKPKRSPRPPHRTRDTRPRAGYRGR